MVTLYIDEKTVNFKLLALFYEERLAIISYPPTSPLPTNF